MSARVQKRRNKVALLQGINSTALYNWGRSPHGLVQLQKIASQLRIR